jgi:hypothetical protein
MVNLPFTYLLPIITEELKYGVKAKGPAPVSTPGAQIKTMNGLAAPPSAGAESVVSSDGEAPSPTPAKSVSSCHLLLYELGANCIFRARNPRSGSNQYSTCFPYINMIGVFGEKRTFERTKVKDGQSTNAERKQNDVRCAVNCVVECMAVSL